MNYNVILLKDQGQAMNLAVYEGYCTAAKHQQQLHYLLAR
jgi:hypothetical protein